MRIIATLVSGIVGYVVVLIILSEGVGVAADSAWYWLPFIVSLCAVVAVAVPWRTWRSVNRTTTVATTCLLGVLVLAIDLASAIWYSCAKGVCL